MTLVPWRRVERGWLRRLEKIEAFVTSKGNLDFLWSVYEVNAAGYANANVDPLRRGLARTLAGAQRCATRAMIGVVGEAALGRLRAMPTKWTMAAAVAALGAQPTMSGEAELAYACLDRAHLILLVRELVKYVDHLEDCPAARAIWRGGKFHPCGDRCKCGADAARKKVVP